MAQLATGSLENFIILIVLGILEIPLLLALFGGRLELTPQSDGWLHGSERFPVRASPILLPPSSQSSDLKTISSDKSTVPSRRTRAIFHILSKLNEVTDHVSWRR